VVLKSNFAVFLDFFACFCYHKGIKVRKGEEKWEKLTQMRLRQELPKAKEKKGKIE
jgi:hypothetical protein